MDLWMPAIGGEKAIELLKSDSSTRSIPIVIFSATNDTAKVAVRSNADGCLAKPYEIDELYATVKRLIGTTASPRK